MHHIYESIRVGRQEMENRLVMPPMATGKSDDNDFVTDEILAYYGERARFGRVGLVITEHTYIDLQGKASKKQISASREEDVPGLRSLADTIHAQGVKAILQINHAGSAASCAITGQSPVGPSAVSHPRAKEGAEIPEELTKEEIAGIVEKFGRAAKRAKAAGFDGVEIHSAHGYLLNQFYSPLTNFRTDEYGCGSVKNRVRFGLEVVKAVREAVGPNLVVAVRLGGCDYQEGGSTIADCVEACRFFEEAGCDLIDLTGGVAHGYVVPGHSEPGYFGEMTRAVREAIRSPILLTGGIVALSQAEELLASGKADLIGVGRALYQSAHWAEE